jgi:hypothetical protein
MPALDILDVVIGTVFIFLIASLLCSSVSEFIASLLHLRAKELERGIGELIGDPNNQSKLLEALYDHGLVNGLFKGKYANSRPDNAPAATAGAATRPGTPTAPQPGRRNWKTALGQFFKGTYQLPSYVPSENFALAIIDLIEHPPAGVSIPSNVTTTVQAIRNAAVNDFEKGRHAIETWYDSAMDRVSGWYKKRIQLMLLLIGFGVAIVANIDSIQLIQVLSTNGALRQTLVTTAQSYASENKSNPDQMKDARAAIEQNYNQLKALQLPVCVACRWASYPADEERKQIWLKNFVNGFVGYVITAFAVSFGAPFWFDMLNKLIVVRSTVKPKEKSGEEKSKD